MSFTRACVRLFSAFLVAFCGLYIVLSVPVASKSYYRQHFGQYVVKIVGTDSRHRMWSGTGFHILASSGKIYVVTNRHVCNGAADGKLTLFSNGMRYQRKIIELSKSIDLCIVEPVLQSGLRLGGTVAPGQPVITLGHPSGYPLIMTEGEIVGYEIINFFELYQGKGTCVWNDQRIKDVVVPIEAVPRDKTEGHLIDVPQNQLSGKTVKVKICVTTEKSILTTSQIKPGSSGSPVLDLTGHVVGVQHATNLSDNWGRMVTLENLKKFLIGR